MSQWVTLDDGRRLVYHRRGTGPLLVCHPGGPGIGPAYFADMAGLDDDFELLLVHPRGTGGSDRPASPEAYSFEDYASDLEQLRARLGIERFNLLGHSHGGMVAQVYAAEYPGRVGRLVLASTAARLGDPAVAEAMEANLARHASQPWYQEARAALEAETSGRYDDDAALGGLLVREMPLYFADYNERASAYVAALSEEPPNGDALRLLNSQFETFDLSSYARRVTAPTLVLTGADDFITPPPAAHEIGRLVRNSHVSLIPGCGHWSFVEAPDQFRDAVRGFLLGG